MDKEENFVDDWWTHHNDKTMYVQSWAESEYKVTYRSETGKKFSVIFKPKRNPIGFFAK